MWYRIKRTYVNNMYADIEADSLEEAIKKQYTGELKWEKEMDDIENWGEYCSADSQEELDECYDFEEYNFNDSGNIEGEFPWE